MSGLVNTTYVRHYGGRGLEQVQLWSRACQPLSQPFMSTHPDHFVQNHAKALVERCESATPDENAELFKYLHRYAVVLPRSEDLRDDTSLMAASLLVQFNERINHPSLLDAYINLVNKLIMLPWLGLDHWKRLARLQSLPKNLPVAAALCAIGHDDLPLAVRLLDRSRCLILEHGQRLCPDRADMARLKALLSSDTYDRLEMLIRQLHVGMAGVPPRSIAVESESEKRARCDKENEYATYAQELDEMLRWIREQEGFEGFMLPCSDMEALRLVEVGHVVIMLPARTHCSVIMITKSDSSPKMKHLVLSGISEDSARVLAGKFVHSLRAAGRHSRGAPLDENTPIESSRYFIPQGQKSSNTPESVMQQVLSQLWITIGLPIVQALSLSVRLYFQLSVLFFNVLILFRNP